MFCGQPFICTPEAWTCKMQCLRYVRQRKPHGYHVSPTRPEGPPRQTGWVRLPNIIRCTISRPLRAISREVSLNPAQTTFAPQGAHPKNMAMDRAQSAILLLASIGDLHLKFPTRKVTRDGLRAITKMQPMTKRKTLNRPI